MAGYVAVAVEGVLADEVEGEPFAASKVVPHGTLLYHALRRVTKVILLVEGDHNPDHVRHWLKSHGFISHLNVLFSSEREQAITQARRMGAVDLVIEADPTLAARTLALGVPTLLLSTPPYTREEFRPDTELVPRAWEDLLAELERQQELRTQDERITADVAGTRYEDG